MEQNIFTIFLFLALTSISVCYATDYCNPSLCSYRKHIACGHDGKLNDRCPWDAKIVPMSKIDKRLIIGEMNKYRNFIAGGYDKNHKPACRMASIQWNEELAQLAVLNVKQCALLYDECHNTDRFKYSGQNIAIQRTAGEFNITFEYMRSIYNWYDEVKNSQMSYIKSYPMNYNGPDIGHFRVLVDDKNTHAGCAAITYSENDLHTFLFACNFATTNLLNIPAYKCCSKAATECQTGTRSKLINLCSYKEPIDANRLF